MGKTEEEALGKIHRHLIIDLGSYAILIKANLVWYSEGQEIVVLSLNRQGKMMLETEQRFLKMPRMEGPDLQR